MKIVHADQTGWSDLKYLVRDRDRHGNVRIYVRHAGVKTRIRSDLGTESFFAEYKLAISASKMKGTGTVRTETKESTRGTFRWLLEKYFADNAFLSGLGPGTQTVRRQILERIASKHGGKPYKLLEPRHIVEMQNDYRGKPEAFNGALKALRQLFKWAIPRGLADQNPAIHVPYLKANGDGHYTWTDRDMVAFEEFHRTGTMARLAYDLIRFTGMRKSDAIRIGPNCISADGKTLSWVEKKNEKRNPKRITQPLAKELDESIKATPSGKETFIITKFGKPFTVNGFGNWFRARCDEAGLMHCTAHGIRKATAAIAAEHGATELELMAFHGWENPKQAAHYTRKASRQVLAASAAEKVRKRRR